MRLLSKLLRLLGKLLRLLGKLLGLPEGWLGWLEVSWQSVDFSVLVLITGKSVKGNIFSGQLGCGNQGLLGLLLELLGCELLLSELLLLLRSKLLLLLGSKLLLLLSKLLLLLRSKLLLLLGSKLLLLLGGKMLLLELLLLELRVKSWPLWLLLKLLLLSWCKLLLLLLLLELLEILVEVLGVELLGSWLVWVELSGVEHRSSLLTSALVSKSSPLGGVISLLSNYFLLLDNSGLVCKDCCMSLLLQGEFRAGCSGL